MEKILEKLYTLLNSMLLNNVPVLSGNSKRHINIVEIEPHKVVIKIEAPFYDSKIWRKENRIVFTGPRDGVTGYAQFLNERTRWVNETTHSVCEIIADEYGAILDDRIGGNK